MDQSERASTHMNALKTDKPELNSELIKREDVAESPFTVITTEEGSFGVMGQYRITEPHKNKGKVIKELKKITWNRIIQVIMLLNEIKTDKK